MNGLELYVTQQLHQQHGYVMSGVGPRDIVSGMASDAARGSSCGTTDTMSGTGRRLPRVTQEPGEGISKGVGCGGWGDGLRELRV